MSAWEFAVLTIVKSSDDALMPGMISFLDDASNGSNTMFTSLANTVSLAGEDIVLKLVIA